MEQLVGRRQELAAIDVFLEEEDGGFAASLIEGEAGIGKTRSGRTPKRVPRKGGDSDP